MTNDKLREALAFAEGWLAGCLIPPTMQQDAEAIPHLRTLIATAKAALAAPVEAEPVAWQYRAQGADEWSDLVFLNQPRPNLNVETRPLYAHPAEPPVEAEPVAQVARSPEGFTTLDEYTHEALKDHATAVAMWEAAKELIRERAAHPAEQGKDAEDAIPREPTEAMRLAAFAAYERGDRCLNLWYAMYDAAQGTRSKP